MIGLNPPLVLVNHSLMPLSVYEIDFDEGTP